MIESMGNRIDDLEAALAAAEARASAAEAATAVKEAEAREWHRLYDELIDAVVQQRIAERRAA